jgi:hypothetical protein
MRHRRIGSTDLVVSEVGLAVGPLVAGPGARPDEEVAACCAAALDLGIGYFAATDSDDDGRAEELLGRPCAATATRSPWPPPSATTPPRGPGSRPRGPRHDWSADFAGRALDRSLGRLRPGAGRPVAAAPPGHGRHRVRRAVRVPGGPGEQGQDPRLRGGPRPGPGWGDEGAAALQERRVAAVETVYNVAEQARAATGRLAAETGAGLVARDPLAPRLPAAARARLEFLERDRDQTLDQALLRLRPGRPGGGHRPARGPRPRPPGRAGRAADLDPPTAEDLDRLAELREARFGRRRRPTADDRHRREPGPVRAGHQGHPGRGELARAGLRRGRGDAPVLRPRAGPYLEDVDGNRYVDLVCSWGPLIAGHAHPRVVEAVQAATARGTSFGAPTEARWSWPRRWPAGPGGGEAAHGQLGHRGHHERGPPGPGGHRPAPLVKVRRLLPRPRRRPAGRRRVGRGHPRAARLARGDRRPRRPTRSSCPTTTRAALADAFAPAATPSPPCWSSHRRQHGVVPPTPAFLAALRVRDPPGRRPAGPGRGHDRLPGPPRRRHRPVVARARPAHLRQGAGRRALRRPPTAGPARLLGPGRPRGPGLPGRLPCPGTRWPPRPAWPPCRCSTTTPTAPGPAGPGPVRRPGRRLRRAGVPAGSSAPATCSACS